MVQVWPTPPRDQRGALVGHVLVAGIIGFQPEASELPQRRAACRGYLGSQSGAGSGSGGGLAQVAEDGMDRQALGDEADDAIISLPHRLQRKGKTS